MIIEHKECSTQKRNINGMNQSQHNPIWRSKEKMAVHENLVVVVVCKKQTALEKDHNLPTLG